MRFVRSIKLLLILVCLVACGRSAYTSTPSLPTPVVTTVHPPSAEAAVRAYLEAFMVEDYSSMYAMLSEASRAKLTSDDFAKRYKNDLDAMSVSKMEYSIESTLTAPTTAQVAFQIIYHTALFGDVQRDKVEAKLSLENGSWRLEWDDGLILPELAGGDSLQVEYRVPARGDIYDRSGNAVVTQTDAVALGLVAGAVPPDEENDLFLELWRLTGTSPDVIRRDYENYQAGQYVPVGETSQEAYNSRAGFLSGFSGWLADAYSSRYGFLSSQAVGFTQPIPAEQVDLYLRKGYSLGQRVGMAGIEKWGEAYLAGKNGAALDIIDASGKFVNTIANTDPQPADSITLTIDRDLQAQSQLAMDGLPGAIVVVELSTGRVLAMVSSPGLDPNLFDPKNRNYGNLQNVLADPYNPELNRAAQSSKPLGSVFKIVTMAAALESGVFTPDSTWDCQYEWTEIPGIVLHDWTYDHCQQELQANPDQPCKTKPSGKLTLPEGLMRSCDPWFYHIGFTLFTQGQGNLISKTARAFGLGQSTGIGQVAEDPGNIPDPSDGLNATSIAIGQGNVLVTPLQVADFIAAVGNGGTLYRPQLVEKIQPVVGDPISVFKPQGQSLGIKPENLKVIQDAMRQVAVNPRGTAYYTLGTFPIPVAAKTGTAESGVAVPHAWFAGYSLADRPDKPDIAVAVVVEGVGEGATWAAPIFRRVMEIYFYGKPQSIYPWESTFGVIRPTETATPTPTP